MISNYEYNDTCIIISNYKVIRLARSRLGQRGGEGQQATSLDMDKYKLLLQGHFKC